MKDRVEEARRAAQAARREVEAARREAERAASALERAEATVERRGGDARAAAEGVGELEAELRELEARSDDQGRNPRHD
jgi:chromosome segregation ATPase